MIRILIGRFGLHFDRNYGCENRTGWTLVWAGSVIIQLVPLWKLIVPAVELVPAIGRFQTRRRAARHNRKHAQLWASDGPSWMCPDCGSVHKPVGRFGLVGNEYPACCSFTWTGWR